MTNYSLIHLVQVPVYTATMIGEAACEDMRAVHFTPDRSLVTCPDCRRVIEDEVTQKMEVPT